MIKYIESKGVTLFQLFRANILDAEGSMRNMVYQRHCRRKLDLDYEKMSREIRAKLEEEDSPYAIGDMVVNLLGRSAAERLSSVASLRIRNMHRKRPIDNGLTGTEYNSRSNAKRFKE